MQRRATAAQIFHMRHGEYRLETRKFQVPEERIIQVKPGDELPVRGAAVKVLVNYDDIARRTGVPVDQPRTCGEAAVSHLFETDAGNILFLGDSLHHNGYKAIGDLGPHAPGAAAWLSRCVHAG